MLESLEKYDHHLKVTGAWIKRSFERRRGGSCAFYSPLVGWSQLYPETTGYLIPTLLRLADYLDDQSYRDLAIEAGEWLLSIQQQEGCWNGGHHPPRTDARPSVFNSSQILQGLCSLYRDSGADRWLLSAERGAKWLSSGVEANGEWRTGHYRSGFQPSYYARVAWPMLEVATLTQDDRTKAAAEWVLAWVVKKRLKNGSFSDWGFEAGAPAFTHTIAYTLRGLIESAEILDDWVLLGAPAEAALERLLRLAELNGGRLAGAFDEDWKADKSFVCVTGSAQVALCLLTLEQRFPDLRLVNGAAKLIDWVCGAQWLRGPRALKGAVPGSVPFHGRYMAFRYPNWAAKFQADALLGIIERMKVELEKGKLA